MKKNLIIVAVFLMLKTFGQEESLKIKHVSLGAGFFTLINNYQSNLSGGGAMYMGELGVSYQKNLFLISYHEGIEFEFMGSVDFFYKEVSLSYGRELKLKNWLAIEGYAGLGYFDLNFYGSNTSISFPLRINTKFYFNKKFGMGLSCNYSVNNISNYLSFNQILFYRFN
jgi:hypothetical protein